MSRPLGRYAPGKDTLALLLDQKRGLVGGLVAVYGPVGNTGATWDQDTHFIMGPGLPVFFEHDPAQVIGEAITFSETPTGITILARLYTRDYFARLNFLMLGWSLGLHGLQNQPDNPDQPSYYRLVAPFEVSLTNIPVAYWSEETQRWRRQMFGVQY